MAMMNSFPPALIFLLSAIAVPFLRGRAKSIFLILIPIIGFINLLLLPSGISFTLPFLDYSLSIVKADRLSMVFGYIFHVIALLAIIYSINFKNDVEYVAGLIYSGSALGVIFAGDLITLFCYWEFMTVGSVFLVWVRKTKKSREAGFRYVLVHFFGGLMLLMGIILFVAQTGSIEFGYIGLSGVASYLIFFGFGVNCAWPFVHSWLSDAYPEASVAGAVFLSAFTTKTAVYVLARSYPGEETLIWIGAVMAAFPIFYAVIENDMRRVLAYSLINQLGFMVVGIGIGTELAINGVAAHAFAHILYKGLLFMSMGAVLHQTGKINATDLGGLYRTMPITALCCIIGAASMSFPLTGGFVSKSMIISSAANEHLTVAWLTLIFATAGVFFVAGIKVPFFTFFGRDSGMRPKEAPMNMRIAMALGAFLCVFIGTFPGTLYSILPYPVDYEPYTVSHVVTQLQLLAFAGLAFALLMLSGIYPAEIRSINLDADWIYRKGVGITRSFARNAVYRPFDFLANFFFCVLPEKLIWFGKNPVGVLKMWFDYFLVFIGNNDDVHKITARIRKEKELYPGDIIKHWPIGSTVIWITIFLLINLLVYYL